MARLPYHDPSDVPESYRDAMTPANPYLDGGTGEDPWETPRNTHRIIANQPPLLRAYRRFAADLWQHTGLDERERELVILSVGRRLESAYEWHQHVLVALDDILTEAEIRAIATEEYDVFDESEASLLAYASAFAGRAVDEETFDALAEHYDHGTILGASMLACFYVGIDYMGTALGLDLEEEFVGWDLEKA